MSSLNSSIVRFREGSYRPVGIFLCLLFSGLPLLAEGSNARVVFADPSKPGKLQVYIARGDLLIRPGDTAGEVSVSSSAKKSEPEEPRSDGLRVLSSSAASFTLVSNENSAELSFGRDQWPMTGSSASFEVRVPKDTNVVIENGWGGSVQVEGLSGDVSVKGINCDVNLTEVSGSTVVETMNGKIEASFPSLSDDKPVSFSSMNGEVLLKLPTDAKAKVRFRTHNGNVLTDFPSDKLTTTSENLGGTHWGRFAGEQAKMAMMMAGEFSKGISEAAREMAGEFRKAAKEARESYGQAEAKAEEQRAENSVTVQTGKPRAPKPPRPPSIPAISGGKLVSGSLNGGGADISVSTMNGDIILRKK